MEECREEVRGGWASDDGDVRRGEEWGWEWREEKDRIKRCAAKEARRGMVRA